MNNPTAADLRKASRDMATRSAFFMVSHTVRNHELAAAALTRWADDLDRESAELCRRTGDDLTDILARFPSSEQIACKAGENAVDLPTAGG